MGTQEGIQIKAFLPTFLQIIGECSLLYVPKRSRLARKTAERRYMIASSCKQKSICYQIMILRAIVLY
jgi:hypothetical protein